MIASLETARRSTPPHSITPEPTPPTTSRRTRSSAAREDQRRRPPPSSSRRGRSRSSSDHVEQARRGRAPCAARRSGRGRAASRSRRGPRVRRDHLRPAATSASTTPGAPVGVGVGDEAVVEHHRRRARALPPPIPGRRSRVIPALEALHRTLYGCGMEIEKAIRTRRTHKAYGPREVPREVLGELFELARWAPNHHLTNPWRFRVLGPALARAADGARRGREAGAAAKLARAPTLVAVSALAAASPPRTARTCSRPRRRLSGAARARTRAGSRATGARSRCSDDPRAPRDARDRRRPRRVVGLLYLGEPVQEQRVPERAPPGEFVTYLD